MIVIKEILFDQTVIINAKIIIFHLNKTIFQILKSKTHFHSTDSTFQEQAFRWTRIELRDKPLNC